MDLVERPWPRQPITSGAVIERQPEGVKVWLPAVGFPALGPNRILWLLLWLLGPSFLLLTVAVLILQGFDLEVLLGMGYYAVVFLIPTAILSVLLPVRVARATRELLLEVTEDAVEIRVTTAGMTRTQRWHRREIHAIQASPG